MMIDEDIPSQGYGDYIYSLQDKVKYSKRGEAYLQERGLDFFEVLREQGLGELIKETVNAGSLQSAMKEIAEENDGDRAGLLRAGRQRRAHRKAEAAANDAVGAQHPDAEIGDVLRAALAPARAGGLAVKLRHHGPERRALGDGVAVAPVSALDIVLSLQTGAHAGGHRLLAHIDVDVAEDLTGLAGALRLKVELADLHHGLVMPEQFFSGKHFILPCKKWYESAEQRRAVPRCSAFFFTVLS